MIVVNNLTVRYGKKAVLNDVNFDFKSGKVTCIIGENGSGKSTLLKSIMQMADYDGQVFCNGHNVKVMKREERARTIAYLPQVRPLPHIDVRTLVSHGRFPYLGASRILTGEDKKIVNEVMDVLDLNRFENADVATLSGGERQRVYLAMAMVQSTDIIILDEPLTYMDIKHQDEIIKILRALNREGKTIIYTSHDLPQAFSFSDEVMVLDKGRQIISGPKDTVALSGHLGAIFGMDIVKEESQGAYYDYKLAHSSESINPAQRINELRR